MRPTTFMRFATLLAALALASCAQNPVTGSPNLVLISESQEIAIGKREDTNGREHELEADRLGAEYLARTGYDPQAMVKVVGVLKNQELFGAELAQAEGRQPRAYHGLFASHPDNDTRLQQVVGEAFIDLRGGGPMKDTPADVLRRALRLPSGAEVKPLMINELQAAIVSTTLDGRPTRVACVFHGSSTYLIAAQARTAAAFGQFEDAIQAALTSFHGITEEEKAFARPLKLRVITAQPGLTFAALARRSPLGRFAEGHLRVINGLYPKGEPVAGQPLKIVE